MISDFELVCYLVVTTVVVAFAGPARNSPSERSQATGYRILENGPRYYDPLLREKQSISYRQPLLQEPVYIIPNQMVQRNAAIESDTSSLNPKELNANNNPDNSYEPESNKQADSQVEGVNNKFVKNHQLSSCISSIANAVKLMSMLLRPEDEQGIADPANDKHSLVGDLTSRPLALHSSKADDLLGNQTSPELYLHFPLSAVPSSPPIFVNLAGAKIQIVPPSKFASKLTGGNPSSDGKIERELGVEREADEHGTERKFQGYIPSYKLASYYYPQYPSVPISKLSRFLPQKLGPNAGVYADVIAPKELEAPVTGPVNHQTVEGKVIEVPMPIDIPDMGSWSRLSRDLEDKPVRKVNSIDSVPLYRIKDRGYDVAESPDQYYPYAAYDPSLYNVVDPNSFVYVNDDFLVNKRELPDGGSGAAIASPTEGSNSPNVVSKTESKQGVTKRSPKLASEDKNSKSKRSLLEDKRLFIEYPDNSDIISQLQRFERMAQEISNNTQVENNPQGTAKNADSDQASKLKSQSSDSKDPPQPKDLSAKGIVSKPVLGQVPPMPPYMKAPIHKDCRPRLPGRDQNIPSCPKKTIQTPAPNKRQIPLTSQPTTTTKNAQENSFFPTEEYLNQSFNATATPTAMGADSDQDAQANYPTAHYLDSNFLDDSRETGDRESYIDSSLDQNLYPHVLSADSRFKREVQQLAKFIQMSKEKNNPKSIY